MSSNSTRPIALVLGANGRFGAAAVQAFAAAGWRVLAQVRREPDALPPGAERVAVDMADGAALAKSATGASVVVYAVNPPYAQWTAQALPLLRQGIAAARRLNATLMLPGNVYNFGAGMPALLDEHTPQRPSTRKGRIRVQMEGELGALAAAGELRSIVVRAGDFFGGGTGSWFDLMIVRSLRHGKLVYPGPPDVPHAWAYLPDLARALVAAAARADELPAIADLPFAGHALTGAELLDAIERAAAAMGLTPGRGRFEHRSLPWALFRLGGLVVPLLREVSEMSYLWRVPHALDGTALQRVVGALPATPLDTALRESLRALGFAAGRPANAARARHALRQHAERRS